MLPYYFSYKVAQNAILSVPGASQDINWMRIGRHEPKNGPSFTVLRILHF